MSALNGSATFRRFFVTGKPKPGLRERAMRSINTRRFTPATESETVSFGWVPLTEPLADRLGPEDVFVGDLVCLGFRQDEKVVRAGDVKDELKQRARELQYEKGRRLSRDERNALKEVIVAELRARAPVRRRVAELVWNPDRQEIRLYGASKPMIVACVEMFNKTFELDMEEATVEGVMMRVGTDPRKVRFPFVSLAGPAMGASAKASRKEDRDEEVSDAPF